MKVLSYFNGDWYINQLKRPYYDSPPYKLYLSDETGRYGPYDPLYIQERTDQSIRWDKYIKALKGKNPRLLIQTMAGDEYFILPSRALTIPVDGKRMNVRVKENYLSKSDMAILDLIYSNGLSRPMYFNFTSLNSLGIDVKSYLRQEGLIYKLSTEKNPSQDIEIDCDKMYENLVIRSNYTNLADPEVYFNHEDYQQRMINPLKQAFNHLIGEYIEKREINKAREIVDFAIKNIYFSHFEPGFPDIQMAKYLRLFEERTAANDLVRRVFEFHFKKVAKSGQIDKVGLYLLQESVRFLDDAEVIRRYNQLMTSLRG